MIRVLLADDHAVVRTGLAQMLEGAGDIEVVGAAQGGREAVELSERHRPDVVLMDLSMPDMDGIEATRAIREVGTARQVLVLTSFSERNRILAAIDAGAVGYLLKDAEPGEVMAGIRAAARGESPLSPKAATEVLRARTEHRPSHDLTDREQQVLALVAAGHPNKEIARRLDISEKTVKAHLTSVFRQIDVYDRTQAALWARRHGVVQDSA